MIEFESYFSIQIFFIILRETLETAIIVSVLLSFINQRSHTPKKPSTSIIDHENDEQHANTQIRKVQRKMKVQVWAGAILGLVICLVIGLIFILAFYFIGKDFWSYTERIWEGVFSILSSIIITIMGIGLLRINKVMKVKWWMKLGDAYNQEEDEQAEVNKHREESEDLDYGSGSGSLEQSDELNPLNNNSLNLNKFKQEKHRSSFTKKYFLAILPFVTTLREGLEAVVFVGGIGMSQEPSSLPLSIIGGITCGTIIGLILYKGGNKLSLQYFLILSTCFLYMVSAGLMSRGIWFLELEKYVRLCGGLDVSETGSGPGSYDIGNSIWHVNCCNGLTDGWWMVFNAILGWTNSATYGSVGSYIGYWLIVIIWLEIKLYEEKQGYLPLFPIKWQLKRIKKKVKLYETRISQQRENHQHNQTINENSDAYLELRSDPSNELDSREAEAQLLLAQ